MFICKSVQLGIANIGVCSVDLQMGRGVDENAIFTMDQAIGHHFPLFSFKGGELSLLGCALLGGKERLLPVLLVEKYLFLGHCDFVGGLAGGFVSELIARVNAGSAINLWLSIKGE